LIKLSKKLQKLEHFLLSSSVGENAMLLTELDGFLAGLAVSPEEIKEAEWLPKIWGQDEPSFKDAAEKRALLETVLERFTEISASLKKDKFDPVMEPDVDGAILWEGWVVGFKQAVMLRPSGWLIHDSSKSGDGRLAFSLLMRLAELESQDTEPQEGDEALERDVLLLIPHCARKLFLAREALFGAKNDNGTSVAPGRNDPCLCGSGKKFKKCCLN
jgi:uncharacterized protein